MEKTLDKQVAIVTGASRGIGRRSRSNWRAWARR
jgi:short-subunit dehydrogenase